MKKKLNKKGSENGGRQLGLISFRELHSILLELGGEVAPLHELVQQSINNTLLFMFPSLSRILSRNDFRRR